VNSHQAEEKYHTIIRESIQRAELYDPQAPSLRIFHEFSLAEFVGRGPRVGFSFFEINLLDDIRKHHINNVDEMIVCSEWAKQILNEQTNKIAHIVDLGVDTEVFIPTHKQHQDKTIFLNVGRNCFISLLHDFVNAKYILVKIENVKASAAYI